MNKRKKNIRMWTIKKTGLGPNFLSIYINKNNKFGQIEKSRQTHTHENINNNNE